MSVKFGWVPNANLREGKHGGAWMENWCGRQPKKGGRHISYGAILVHLITSV